MLAERSTPGERDPLKALLRPLVEVLGRVLDEVEGVCDGRLRAPLDGAVLGRVEGVVDGRAPVPALGRPRA